MAIEGSALSSDLRNDVPRPRESPLFHASFVRQFPLWLAKTKDRALAAMFLQGSADAMGNNLLLPSLRTPYLFTGCRRCPFTHTPLELMGKLQTLDVTYMHRSNAQREFISCVSILGFFPTAFAFACFGLTISPLHRSIQSSYYTYRVEKCVMSNAVPICSARLSTSMTQRTNQTTQRTRLGL